MSQLRVRDLMTTEVITVKPTDTIRQAVIRMAIDNVTGAPVVDNRNHVLGIITQTDILKLILGRNAYGTFLGQIPVMACIGGKFELFELLIECGKSFGRHKFLRYS